MSGLWEARSFERTQYSMWTNTSSSLVAQFIFFFNKQGFIITLKVLTHRQRIHQATICLILNPIEFYWRVHTNSKCEKVSILYLLPCRNVHRNLVWLFTWFSLAPQKDPNFSHWVNFTHTHCVALGVYRVFIKQSFRSLEWWTKDTEVYRDIPLALTDSNCSHHGGHDDGESDSAGDHQVPLMVGDVFAFVAVVDLMEGRRVEWVAVRARTQRSSHFHGAGKPDRTLFIWHTFKMQKAVSVV